MAYTFQRALGVTTGKSLVEEDRLDYCKELLEKALRYYEDLGKQRGDDEKTQAELGVCLTSLP